MGMIAEEIGIIRYKGTFDMTGLLRMIKHYLETERRYTFYERMHKAKIPKLELKWHADRKTTGYYKYNIDLEFVFHNVKEVEVEVNGHKKKMTHARMWLKFDGGVDKDFTNTWHGEKSEIRAKLQHFFENVIMKKEFLAKHALPLIGEVTVLRDKIYAYLGMVAGEEEEDFGED